MKKKKLTKKIIKGINGRSLSELKKIRWDMYAWKRKLEESDKEGLANCCTCKRSLSITIGDRPNGKCQAGHYRSRRYIVTLYHDRNVHIQCSGCNKYMNGNPVPYKEFLDKRYGEKTARVIDLLILRSKRYPVKVRKFDTEQAIIEYKKIVIDLLATKSDEVQEAYKGCKKYKDLLKFEA